MTNSKVVYVGDLPANDGTNRTWREVNLDIPHRIPLGTLVEIVDSENDYNHEDAEGFGALIGLRLFVVSHDRDLDGEPLYSLAVEKKASVKYIKCKKDFDRRNNASIQNDHARMMCALARHNLTCARARLYDGYSESGLKVIRLPADTKNKSTVPE